MRQFIGLLILSVAVALVACSERDTSAPAPADVPQEFAWVTAEATCVRRDFSSGNTLAFVLEDPNGQKATLMHASSPRGGEIMAFEDGSASIRYLPRLGMVTVKNASGALTSRREVGPHNSDDVRTVLSLFEWAEKNCPST